MPPPPFHVKSLTGKALCELVHRHRNVLLLEATLFQLLHGSHQLEKTPVLPPATPSQGCLQHTKSRTPRLKSEQVMGKGPSHSPSAHPSPASPSLFQPKSSELNRPKFHSLTQKAPAANKHSPTFLLPQVSPRESSCQGMASTQETALSEGFTPLCPDQQRTEEHQKAPLYTSYRGKLAFAHNTSFSFSWCRRNTDQVK